MDGAVAGLPAFDATGICAWRGLRTWPARYLAGRAGGSTLQRPHLNPRNTLIWFSYRMANGNKNPDPEESKPEPELLPAPLAYLNPEFLNSPDGRLLRILSEYS